MDDDMDKWDMKCIREKEREKSTKGYKTLSTDIQVALMAKKETTVTTNYINSIIMLIKYH
jgi:hypothetical protein